MTKMLLTQEDFDAYRQQLDAQWDAAMEKSGLERWLVYVERSIGGENCLSSLREEFATEEQAKRAAQQLFARDRNVLRAWAAKA